MKVPTLTSNRVAAPTTTRAYSNARPNMAGVQALAQGLGAFAAQLQQREEKVNRFGALTELSKFETEMAEHLEEQKRGAPANGAGFARSVEQQYDKFAERFLATRVAPELRDEFTFRAQQLKQGLVGKALDYEYAAGDSFFRQGVKDIYEKARNSLDPRLGGDPSQLEVWKGRVAEAVNLTGLTEAEKYELNRNTTQGLEAVVYRAAVAADAKSYGGNADAANLIKRFEGWSDKAYSDKRTSTGQHDAWRIGYGTDTITKSDGTVVRVNKGDKISREDAERDLRRRIPEFQGVIAKQVGKDTWNGLPGNVQAALTSVAYNYGSLPNSVVTAVASGDVNKIAGAVENLSANKERRAEEAAIIRGEATPPSPLDEDARFANVPYETRVSLREDAMRDAAAEATEEAKQRKAMYESNLNKLLTDIHDGNAGQTEIDRFRESNPGMKFSDLTSLDKALKDYSEGVGLASATLGRIESGYPLDPTDTNTKKGLNALIGKDGIQALSEGNQEYVSSALVPLVTKGGVIPSDVVGLLTGMVRSNNQGKALFALDTLSQLADADPRAFDSQVPDSLQDDVEYWRARRGLVPDDELMKQLNPGVSMEERQARQQLRKDADTILSKIDTGTKLPTINGLVQQFVKKEGSFWFSSDAQISSIPYAAAAINKEYRTLFTDAYERYGNVEDAQRVTEEKLAKRWKVTEVGQKVLMRNPPEDPATGYKPYNGSYKWITDQIRTEHKLGSEDFQLISDEETDREVRLRKAGQLDRPVSYKVVSYKDGIWKELPGRTWVQVPEKVKREDEEYFDRRARASQVSRELVELGNLVKAAELGGQDVPQEDLDALEALRKEYHELRKVLREENPENKRRLEGERAAQLGAEVGRMVGNANNR